MLCMFWFPTCFSFSSGSRPTWRCENKEHDNKDGLQQIPIAKLPSYYPYVRVVFRLVVLLPDSNQTKVGDTDRATHHCSPFVIHRVDFHFLVLLIRRRHAVLRAPACLCWLKVLTRGRRPITPHGERAAGSEGAAATANCVAETRAGKRRMRRLGWERVGDAPSLPRRGGSRVVAVLKRVVLGLMEMEASSSCGTRAADARSVVLCACASARDRWANLLVSLRAVGCGPAARAPGSTAGGLLQLAVHEARRLRDGIVRLKTTRAEVSVVKLGSCTRGCWAGGGACGGHQAGPGRQHRRVLLL